MKILPLSFDSKQRLIHSIEHVLHALGWPLVILGGIIFLGSLDFFWGENSVFGWLISIIMMPVGLVLLHISWNLRKNFRRIILD